MDRNDIPVLNNQSMSWLAEAKELVRNGFLLSVETGGIDDQVIFIKAVHAKYGNVLLGSWTKEECPIRFNWIKRVA